MPRWIKAVNTDEGKKYTVKGLGKVFDDSWDDWYCAKDMIENFIRKRQDLTLIGMMDSRVNARRLIA